MEIIDLCTGCVQVISNPICPNCSSKHVITWLRDKNLPAYKINLIKRYFKKLVQEAEETPSSTRCIICKSKKVNLCVYCFTNKAKTIIYKNTNQGIFDNFKEDFDTHIWRVHKV